MSSATVASSFAPGAVELQAGASVRELLTAQSLKSLPSSYDADGYHHLGVSYAGSVEPSSVVYSSADQGQMTSLTNASAVVGAVPVSQAGLQQQVVQTFFCN